MHRAEVVFLWSRHSPGLGWYPVAAREGFGWVNFLWRFEG